MQYPLKKSGQKLVKTNRWLPWWGLLRSCLDRAGGQPDSLGVRKILSQFLNSSVLFFWSEFLLELSSGGGEGAVILFLGCFCSESEFCCFLEVEAKLSMLAKMSFVRVSNPSEEDLSLKSLSDMIFGTALNRNEVRCTK